MADDSVELIAQATAEKVITRYSQAAERLLAASAGEDVTEDDIISELYDLSDGSLDQFASEAVRESVRSGRTDELSDPANGLPEGVTWRRTSVLEPSTCGPCEAADGEEVDIDDDLSELCEGSEQCRCFVLADLTELSDEEAAAVEADTGDEEE